MIKMTDQTEPSNSGVQAPVTIPTGLLNRLDSRRNEGETRIDVVERLLDETVVEVPIEDILTEALDHFDHVSGITVHLPFPERMSSLHVTVNTGDIDEHHVDGPLHYSGRHHASITNLDGERFVIPFTVVASVDGPSCMETIESTPVYVADSVVDADPLTLEDGLERLRRKVGKSFDEIREMLHTERQLE